MDVFENWDHWIETPLGSWLLKQEQCWMDKNLEDVFGYNAIQIGSAKLDSLRSNRIQCKARLCFSNKPHFKVENSDILKVSQELLPLESQSIDLFVLSHVIETVKNPHQFLREVERVLIPEGKLVICGFNSVSLWAMHRKFVKEDFVKGMSDWIGIARLKDWCELLDLKIVGGEYSNYLPPLNSSRWIEKFQWMEDAGARWWPTAGAVYYLTVIKRNSCMKLIKPKKWRSPKFKKYSAASIGKTITGDFKSNENR